jgi:hypothetical protein
MDRKPLNNEAPYPMGSYVEWSLIFQGFDAILIDVIRKGFAIPDQEEATYSQLFVRAVLGKK